MVPTLPASAKVRGSTLNRLAAEVARAKSPGLTAATLSSMYDMRPRQRYTPNPWYMEGVIESGTAKIYFYPGMVSNPGPGTGTRVFIPKIDGVSLINPTPPGLVVTGSAGVTYIRATVDAAGFITDAIIGSASAVPDDTTTGTLYKYQYIGEWTASGGVFTSVNTVLNTNQTFRMCAGVAEWY